MSAAPIVPAWRIEPMTVRHVDEVAAIEASVYPFPWTRGNFIDSLAAGYFMETVLDPAGRVIAYDVAMKGVEEMHLLNITVAAPYWGLGHARVLLDRLVLHSRAAGAQTLWLEVRVSNEHARRIYERYGFRAVGMRRGYYPAPQQTREDAIVMSLAIAGGEPRAVD
jgi:ribosomal-protein-alanine N-acetyltransferase